MKSEINTKEHLYIIGKYAFIYYYIEEFKKTTRPLTEYAYFDNIKICLLSSSYYKTILSNDANRHYLPYILYFDGSRVCSVIPPICVRGTVHAHSGASLRPYLSNNKPTRGDIMSSYIKRKFLLNL